MNQLWNKGKHILQSQASFTQEIRMIRNHYEESIGLVNLKLNRYPEEDFDLLVMLIIELAMEHQFCQEIFPSQVAQKEVRDARCFYFFFGDQRFVLMKKIPTRSIRLQMKDYPLIEGKYLWHIKRVDSLVGCLVDEPLTFEMLFDDWRELNKHLKLKMKHEIHQLKKQKKTILRDQN